MVLADHYGVHHGACLELCVSSVGLLTRAGMCSDSTEKRTPQAPVRLRAEPKVAKSDYRKLGQAVALTSKRATWEGTAPCGDKETLTYI